MTSVRYAALFAGLCFAMTPAYAVQSADTAPVPDGRASRMEVSVKGGTSVVLNGQSNALPHRFRYTLRAEFAYQLLDRLQLGAELVLPVSFERNYRLIGALVNAKVGIYQGEIYRLKGVFGFGVGTGPKILSTELDTELSARLWHQAGLQQRWDIVRELFQLGIDISFENLSVISVNLALQFSF